MRVQEHCFEQVDWKLHDYSEAWMNLGVNDFQSRSPFFRRHKVLVQDL